MNKSIETLDRSQVLERMEAFGHPGQGTYLAMYSSILGGICTDPAWMQIPVDDHLVHRGDGVFETLVMKHGGIYQLDAHLRRLAFSAGAIGLELPVEPETLRYIVEETFRVAGVENALARILVSRGPGGFAVNPAESVGAQLYLIVYQGAPPFMETHPGGARIGISNIPAKPAELAQIKTCNYLPNVLMKRESLARGLDFLLACDEAGNLTESFTENFCLVDAGGALVRPPPGRLLEGTTMLRVLELAEKLVERGLLSALRTQVIRENDLYAAREILIFGSTTEVTAVVECEGRRIGEHGPVFHALAELLQADMRA